MKKINVLTAILLAATLTSCTEADKDIVETIVTGVIILVIILAVYTPIFHKKKE